jgi:pyruvate/2-oxoglutarate dehydrogenase complex dihydrolipoamide acyltransferase (E2) component
MRKLLRGIALAGLILFAGMPASALVLQAGKPAATQAQPPSTSTPPRAMPAPPPPAAPVATSEPNSEAGANSKPMSSAEANAAVDKLRQTVQDSMTNGRGPRELSPEAQKAIAEAVDKFLSDPAIKGAIAEKIQTGTPPWESKAAILALMVPFAFFALIGVLFWLWFRSKQARIQAQTTAQMQLIGRFNSGAELAAFLSSPAGMQFMSGWGKPQTNLRNRIARHTSYGAVFGAVGLGALLFSHFAHGLLVIGVILLFLGIGFLISAFLTQRLSSKMETSGSGDLPPVPPPLQ